MQKYVAILINNLYILERIWHGSDWPHCGVVCLSSEPCNVFYVKGSDCHVAYVESPNLAYVSQVPKTFPGAQEIRYKHQSKMIYPPPGNSNT